MKSEGASSPVERALWFIENRLGEEISIESIAKSVDVTDHHLARAFGAVTGQSLMRYVRGRRLTEAARSLATGEPNILKVALEASRSVGSGREERHGLGQAARKSQQRGLAGTGRELPH